MRFVLLAAVFLLGNFGVALAQITSSPQTVNGPLTVQGNAYINGGGLCVNPLGQQGGNAGGICLNASNNQITDGGNLGFSIAGVPGLMLGMTGGAMLGNPIGGMPSIGTLNAQGVQVNGVPITVNGGGLPGINLMAAPYNCVGDGETDDTACVQKAVDSVTTANGGGTIFLGNRFYCIRAIVITKTVRIEGSGNAFQSPATSGGFKDCSANQNLITLASGSDGSVLEDFSITGLTGNTSGWAITINSNHTIVDRVNIQNECGYILDTGNNNGILNNFMFDSSDNGSVSCYGIEESGSIDARIIDNGIALYGNSAVHAFTAGMYFTNGAQGVYVAGNDNLGAQIGTIIDNATNAFFWDTVLGYSTNGQALWIVTTNPSAIISYIQFNGTWSGTAGCWAGLCKGAWSPVNNVSIDNSKGGTISSIRFIGARIIGAGQNTFWANGTGNITDLYVQNSVICGGGRVSGTYYGIVVGNVTDFQLRGSTVGSNCWNQGGANVAASVGLWGATMQNIDIEGNDLYNAGAPNGQLLLGTPFSPTTQMTIDHNIGIDGGVTTVSSTSTVTLPVNPTVAISGTTQVQTMNGGWQGREVWINFTGPAQFTGGGNIVYSATHAQNILVHCSYFSPYWYCQ